ncbi:MAG: ribonuclease III [Akkermansiaceae bacterium]
MSNLEEVIGYQFRDPSLLTEALTHPSKSFETKEVCPHNQRMEFLGDAVIQLVLTERLYNMFPSYPEGQLTKLRARLVSRSALHKFAIGMNLGEYVMLGKGEEASGGRDRASTLADAFESVMGAVYLDGGLGAAKTAVEKICEHWIEQVAESPDERNPKGQLQEKLQALAPESPSYKVLEEVGPDHSKRFKISVEWQGVLLGKGIGKSKKDAESRAAKDALKKENWLGNTD